MTDRRPIVVTGGTGFLGRHVMNELSGRGYERAVALGTADCDLTDAQAADALLRRLRPRAIIHLAAAIGGIGAHVRQPGRFSWANTVMGANVLETARQVGVQKIAVAGTICSYPADAEVPISETAFLAGLPAPATAPYGLAKANLWMMQAAYRAQYGLGMAHVILTNLYGPHDHFEQERSHVAAALVRRFVAAREAGLDEVVVWGDGTATRELLYVEDAARGLVDALERYEGKRPLNLGGSGEISIADLARQIASLIGYRGNIRFDPDEPTGAPRRCLDGSRARRDLGFVPRTDLETGLRRTIQWYVERYCETDRASAARA